MTNTKDGEYGPYYGLVKPDPESSDWRWQVCRVDRRMGLVVAEASGLSGGRDGAVDMVRHAIKALETPWEQVNIKEEK